MTSVTAVVVGRPFTFIEQVPNGPVQHRLFHFEVLKVLDVLCSSLVCVAEGGAAGMNLTSGSAPHAPILPFLVTFLLGTRA